MAKSTRASSRPEFLHSLIRTGYLPDEIPPAVTTRNFASYCKLEYSRLAVDQAIRNRTVSKYDTFSAPVATRGRRHFALVHPLSQLRVSLLITEHRAAIKKIICGSGVSLYQTDESPKTNRAFLGLNFRKWHRERQRIHSECPFILKADISRFFYTAYTHSIPWAVLGKSKAKHLLLNDRRSLERHWAHKLDAALQACQSRETFGIPVGPDTSRIVGEILLAGIEADETFARLISTQPSCRLLDDFTIGFDTENAAHNALTALRDALWTLNLQLNEEKTVIVSSRIPVEEQWKYDFAIIAVSDSDSARQEREVYRLVEVALHYCAQADSGVPAAYACRRIAELKNIRRNFSIILDALFRLSREFPSCISRVAEFLINNQALCQETRIKARVWRWIKSTICVHLSHGHDCEVAWALLVSGVLRIPVDEDVMKPFDKTPRSVVFAILGMLHERGLLSFSLSKWPWRADFAKSGINGEYWLPLYEAVRRKWTKDKRVVSMVRANPTFAKMLVADVTFLEDQILDVAKIDVTRRVFRKSKIKRPLSRGSPQLTQTGALRGGKAVSWRDMVIAEIDY